MARTASVFRRPLEPRARELAAIHCAKAALAMDDGAYRAMLNAVARVDSARDLDHNGRRKVMAHLKRLQEGDLDRQARLIRHLWHRLHALGAVEHDSEQALGAFCKRVAGKERLAWLSTMQCRVVIEALKSWVARTEAARPKSEETACSH